MLNNDNSGKTTTVEDALTQVKSSEVVVPISDKEAS